MGIRGSYRPPHPSQQRKVIQVIAEERHAGEGIVVVRKPGVQVLGHKGQLVGHPVMTVKAEFRRTGLDDQIGLR